MSPRARRNRAAETVSGYAEAVGISMSSEEAEAIASDVLRSLEPIRQLWAVVTIPTWLESWREKRQPPK